MCPNVAMLHRLGLILLGTLFRGGGDHRAWGGWLLRMWPARASRVDYLPEPGTLSPCRRVAINRSTNG